MNTKLVITESKEEKISYNKPGLYKLVGLDVYALAPAQPIEDLDKAYFAGTIVHTTSADYPLGFYSGYLTKDAWKRVSQPVAIEFYD